ncbi:MAG TPA: sulfite exporter TauE/SafE family protein [Terriglobales bacterium]
MNHSSLSLAHAVVLFFAGLLGGALNSVAGGGSFIGFPSLLFTGVPAVPANATNTVALWTGLFFSGGAFRHHLRVRRSVLVALAVVSLSGGILGALLLLRTPGETFLKVIPWLMLFAVLLFIFGPRITGGSRSEAKKDPSTKAVVAAAFFQLLVAIYGGYFGGGMGFVILAMLTMFGMADIHEMNAFKIVLSSATNGIAVVIFIVKHAVYWPEALVMLCGAALGGYFGAHYSLRLPQVWVRRFVIVVGATMSAYFFIRAY